MQPAWQVYDCIVTDRTIPQRGRFNPPMRKPARMRRKQQRVLLKRFLPLCLCLADGLTTLPRRFLEVRLPWRWEASSLPATHMKSDWLHPNRRRQFKPICSAISWTIRSEPVRHSFRPGERPRFSLWPKSPTKSEIFPRARSSPTTWLSWRMRSRRLAVPIKLSWTIYVGIAFTYLDAGPSMRSGRRFGFHVARIRPTDQQAACRLWQ